LGLRISECARPPHPSASAEASRCRAGLSEQARDGEARFVDLKAGSQESGEGWNDGILEGWNGGREIVEAVEVIESVERVEAV
jgi:hypothetical protein